MSCPWSCRSIVSFMTSIKKKSVAKKQDKIKSQNTIRTAKEIIASEDRRDRKNAPTTLRTITAPNQSRIDKNLRNRALPSLLHQESSDIIALSTHLVELPCGVRHIKTLKQALDSAAIRAVRGAKYHHILRDNLRARRFHRHACNPARTAPSAQRRRCVPWQRAYRRGCCKCSGHR